MPPWNEKVGVWFLLTHIICIVSGARLCTGEYDELDRCGTSPPGTYSLEGDRVLATVGTRSSKGMSLDFNWDSGEKISIFLQVMIEAADCLKEEGKENGAGNPQRMTQAKSCPVWFFLCVCVCVACGSQMELSGRRGLTSLLSFWIAFYDATQELNPKLSFYHLCNWNWMRSNNLFSSIAMKVA